MTKRPDEARVHRRAFGDITAEVYLSRECSRPDLWQARVVFFSADGTPREEHVVDHPRNKRLAFRIEKTCVGAFVMPDPAAREEVHNPPPARLRSASLPAANERNAP